MVILLHRFISDSIQIIHKAIIITIYNVSKVVGKGAWKNIFKIINEIIIRSVTESYKVLNVDVSCTNRQDIVFFGFLPSAGAKNSSSGEQRRILIFD